MFLVFEGTLLSVISLSLYLSISLYLLPSPFYELPSASVSVFIHLGYVCLVGISSCAGINQLVPRRPGGVAVTSLGRQV